MFSQSHHLLGWGVYLCPVVGPLVPAGTKWNQLCLAWGKPSLSSQRLPCSPHCRGHPIRNFTLSKLTLGWFSVITAAVFCGTLYDSWFVGYWTFTYIIFNCCFKQPVVWLLHTSKCSLLFSKRCSRLLGSQGKIVLFLTHLDTKIVILWKLLCGCHLSVRPIIYKVAELQSWRKDT